MTTNASVGAWSGLCHETDKRDTDERRGTENYSSPFRLSSCLFYLLGDPNAPLASRCPTLQLVEPPTLFQKKKTIYHRALLAYAYTTYVDSLNSSSGLTHASTKRTKQLASRLNKYVDSALSTLGERVALSVT